MDDMVVIEEFAHALEKMRSGMYIVTSAFGGQLGGCTCVWVSRASFMPPLMSVCLAPGRHTLSIIEQSGSFCINVLGTGSRELARNFGFSTGFKTDKFSSVPHHLSKLGSPVLDEAISFMDCQVESITTVGDHRLVVGKLVEAIVQHETPPFIYDPETFYNDEAERLAFHAT